MKKEIFTLFLIFLFIGLVNAGFDVGNLSHSIDTKYSPGEFLRGWINISLLNEPINSLFNTGDDNPLEIIDLILINQLAKGVDYFCSPNDCGIDYTKVPNSEETSKTFILNTGEEKILGLIIPQGSVSLIGKFSMRITSDAGESSSPQLYIDLFADSIIDWQAYKASGNFLAKRYGCYEGPPVSSTGIFQGDYCEKIRIPKSPRVKIGANVIDTEGKGKNVNFFMTIKEKDDTTNNGFCLATASGTGKISCSPENFAVTEGADFFVCISTDNPSDDDKYSINFEREKVCGFTNSYVGTYHIDFEIFATAETYREIGSFVFDNSELSNAGFYTYNIEDGIYSYTNNRYSGNCKNGCIIPIKLSSNYGSSDNPHQITISDINLEYTTDIRESSNKIYDIEELPAKVSSDFLKLTLDDAEFSLPSEYGEHVFLLELGNREVFEEDITIQKFPEISFLKPTTTAAAVPTNFIIEVDNSDELNITVYNWDFGDNNGATTSENSVEHIYEKIGKYLLTINVTESNQLTSSKSFNVSVNPPIESIKTTLNRQISNLNRLKTQGQEFSPFTQNSIYALLNLTDVENRLMQIQSSFNLTTNQTLEQIYLDMMKDLLEINLPRSIGVTKSADSILFYSSEENINVDILQSIDRGNYQENREADYINAILIWNQENLETKIGFKEITAIYDNFNEPLLTTFRIDIKRNFVSPDNPFIIMKDIKNLNFKEDYGQQKREGYIYISMPETEKTIEFSTTEDVDFVTLPLFISPEINALSFIDFNPAIPVFQWKWAVLVLFIILLILIGIAGYITLQKWYKKKYEKHLFKNKNDLFNMVSYINRMEKKDTKKSEIEKNLRKSGWSSEQVRYATKKYSKKRTGMLEIPIDKILGKLREKSKKNSPRKY